MLDKNEILGASRREMTEEQLEVAVRNKRALKYLYSKNKKRFGLYGFRTPNGDAIYSGIEFKPTILNFFKSLLGFARKSTILFTYLVPFSFDSWAAEEMIALGLTDADLDRSENYITHNNPYGNLMDKIKERDLARSIADPDSEDFFFEDSKRIAEYQKLQNIKLNIK